MSTTVRWKGIDPLGRWLKATRTGTADDVAAVLFQEGESIMAKSKKDTPVDTGRLRTTGHVKDPTQSGSKVEVELAYGTDYAVFVHEIEGRNHPTGKAKFLEDAMHAAEAGIGRRLADKLEGRLRRGF